MQVRFPKDAVTRLQEVTDLNSLLPVEEGLALEREVAGLFAEAWRIRHETHSDWCGEVLRGDYTPRPVKPDGGFECCKTMRRGQAWP